MIATTIEMSKRLLDAGLDAATADMVWYKAVNSRWYLAIKIKGEVPFGECDAWSIGALWDIIHEHNRAFVYDTGEESAEDLLESLVTRLEAMASLDFI